MIRVLQERKGRSDTCSGDEWRGDSQTGNWGGRSSHGRGRRGGPGEQIKVNSNMRNEIRVAFSQFYDPLKLSKTPGSEESRRDEENEAIYRLLIS